MRGNRVTMMQNHTPAWVRLTEAGSVTDGRGERQGLHREGFSQVEGQGEDFGEDKHKAPTSAAPHSLSLRNGEVWLFQLRHR